MGYSKQDEELIRKAFENKEAENEGKAPILYVDKLIYNPKATSQRQKLKILKLELSYQLTRIPDYQLDKIEGPVLGKSGEWIYTFKFKLK